MTKQEIEILLEKQRAYYRTGATISIKFRIEQLKKLYETVRNYQNEINEDDMYEKINLRYFMCINCVHKYICICGWRAVRVDLSVGIAYGIFHRSGSVRKKQQ